MHITLTYPIKATTILNHSLTIVNENPQLKPSPINSITQIKITLTQTSQ